MPQLQGKRCNKIMGYAGKIYLIGKGCALEKAE
jgi:hypothetical protein